MLNPEGQVTPVGPQGRVKSNTKGEFEFTNVNADLQAGYQLGTRVDGKLYSSNVFLSNRERHSWKMTLLFLVFPQM